MNEHITDFWDGLKDGTRFALLIAALGIALWALVLWLSHTLPGGL